MFFSTDHVFARFQRFVRLVMDFSIFPLTSKKAIPVLLMEGILAGFH